MDDSLVDMFIACRMGSVGIIAVLQDGGAAGALKDSWDDLRHIPLHPLQFVEICAQVRYKAMLFNRAPEYAIHDGNPVRVVQMPLSGLSSEPVFDEWDPKVYATVLSEFTGLPEDRLYQPSGRTATWLRDDGGRARQITFDQQPWPPDLVSSRDDV